MYKFFRKKSLIMSWCRWACRSWDFNFLRLNLFLLSLFILISTQFSPISSKPSFLSLSSALCLGSQVTLRSPLSPFDVFHPKEGESRKNNKGETCKTLFTSYPFTPSSSLLILQDPKSFLSALRKGWNALS